MRRRAARLTLPRVHLALIEEPVLERRDEALRRRAVVVEVTVAATGERDPRRVLEVIVPQRVEPTPTLGDGPHHRDVLRLVLADQPDLPVASGGASSAHA